MATRIGSQLRERLKDTPYTIICPQWEGTVVLQQPGGPRELWRVNDHHAGYTIQIGRWGYEYVRDFPNSID